jgi:hypothetical protein
MIHLTFMETPHLHTPNEAANDLQTTTNTNPGPSSEYVEIDALKTIQQDPVDDLLEKQDGLIKRGRDSKL